MNHCVDLLWSCSSGLQASFFVKTKKKTNNKSALGLKLVASYLLSLTLANANVS